ncbi:anaerobic ribonucleoside-triphosphate reductase [Microbulbifer sp. TRSA002]|uniref:anaerobic ribonucleoside-triphosphate reductase n=1 Tax=Microbulbifer sp. TRSA002 TaxID=3243382 RepID=UPI004039762C
MSDSVTPSSVQPAHAPARVATDNYLVVIGGRIQTFDRRRITRAILSAGRATDAFDMGEAELLTEQVVKVISHRFDADTPVGIEAIQDIVKQVLISNNYLDVARGYIAYRSRHQQLSQDRRTFVDVTASIDEYLQREDWRVAANANQGYSLGGLILNSAGKMIANYWLNHVYAPEIGAAHREGDLHIHDLDMLAGYCAGWSLRTLLQEGLNGVPGKVESAPPKYLSSAIGQIVNFLGTLENEWAGAQAFSSFDTYMAPFIRKDGLSYEEVRQCIQELIFNLNVPSRWDTQTPFTNLTFTGSARKTCASRCRGSPAMAFPISRTLSTRI